MSELSKYGTFKYGTAIYGGDYTYIFDRTKQDLNKDTFKAYINYTDLNRIESRIKKISEMLCYHAYPQQCDTRTWEHQTSTDTTENIPLKSRDMERIRNNIKKLISQFYVFSYTPALPDNFENIDIKKMNEIEKTLFDLHQMIRAMIDNFRECDTFECGEE